MPTSLFIKFFFIVIVVILFITMFFTQKLKNSIYFKPSREFVGYPENSQEITIEGKHGIFIQPKEYYGNSFRKVILFCHGNAGNISTRKENMRNLSSLGFPVLIFDYSGYGKSKGTPSERGFFEDGKLFLNFLLQKYEKSDIVLVGESIGGAVAAHLARVYQIPKLILVSSIVSMRDIIKTKTYLQITSFFFPEFDTIKELDDYSGEIFFIHSLNDELIDYETTLPLRERSKYVFPVKGRHNDPDIPWKEISEFIKN